MMRLHTKAAIFAGVSMALLAACATFQRKTQATRELTIVYTGNLGSELEPCGCRERPIGGVVRKENYLEQLRKQGKELLLIDSGDLLFESNKIHPDLQPQMIFKAAQMLDAYNLLGHDVLVPGERDFAAGRETLLSLLKGAKFPVLSANLVHPGTGKQLFPSSTVIERAGLKIGIVGINADTLINEFYSAEVKALPPKEALTEALSDLPRGVDRVIVVAHMESREAHELAQNFPEISLWFTADSGGTDHPENVRLEKNDQLFFLPMVQAQKLGLMSFIWKAEGRRWINEALQTRLQREVENLKKELEEFESADPNEAGGLVGQHAEAKRKQIAEREPMLARGSVEEILFQHSMLEMSDVYDGVNALEFVVKNYKQAVKTKKFDLSSHASALPAPKTTGIENASAVLTYEAAKELPASMRPKGVIQPGAEGVSTSLRCQSCHEAQAAFQEKTPHHSAILALYSRDQHMNIECLTCHTIGYREPGGWTKIEELVTKTRGEKAFDLDRVLKDVFKNDEQRLLASRKEPQRWKALHERYKKAMAPYLDRETLQTKNYLGVQCEHCHGRRANHPGDGKDYPDAVHEEACLTCHTPETSDSFAFEKKRPLVACPKMQR